MTRQMFQISLTVDGNQAKQVILYPGISPNEVQSTLKASFKFQGTCVGIEDSSGTSYPLTMLCTNPSSFISNVFTLVVKKKSRKGKGHSKKKERSKKFKSGKSSKAESLENKASYGGTYVI